MNRDQLPGPDMFWFGREHGPQRGQDIFWWVPGDSGKPPR